VNLIKYLYLKGEIAGSIFSRDTRSNEVSDFSPSIPQNVFRPRISSRMDYASVISLGRDGKIFSIKTTGRYYGDGYVPLGYPFLQTDRFDITVDPKLSAFKNKLQLSGSIGRRVNNLSGIRGTTTTQTLGAVNLNLQFTGQFSISAIYSNFGIRNSISNDTLKVNMITNSWNVSPVFMHTTEKCTQYFTLLYAQNTFTDFNTISGELNNNDAGNGVFSYMLSMANKPISFTTMLNYFDNNTSIGKIVTKSVNVSLGYKFLKNRLNTSVGLIIAENKIGADISGSQLMTIFSMKYTVKKKIAFSLNGSVNNYKYGISKPGITYMENLIRTSITYKI
jgi:hypothetical protein